MAGKFMKRDAIISTVRGLDRIQAVRKRKGLTRHPIRTAACGCSDEGCGAFHVIDTDRTLPTPEEAVADLQAHSRRERKS